MNEISNVETNEKVEMVNGKNGTEVARKILRLRTVVENVKASKMSAMGLNYNYLSERDLTTTLRPVMQELGLIALPIESTQETTVYELGKDKSGEPRKVLLTTVHKTYRVFDTESNDYLDITCIGSGADTMDKGCNKAVTGALKNFLKDIGMFPSPDRDDVDTFASPQYGGNAGTRPAASGGASTAGSITLKYGTHAGKTIQQLYNESPMEVQKLANGTSKWIAQKAQEFLASVAS